MNTRPLFSLTYHAIFLLFLSLSISKFSSATTLSNETDWHRDKKYLGFIKRQRYKVFFFVLNLIPKRRRFGTDIKINIRLKRRRFGIVELKYRNPSSSHLILSCAVPYLSQTLTLISAYDSISL